MQEGTSFQTRLKKISEQMKKNQVDDCIKKLKQLEKDINGYIELHPNDNQDQNTQFYIAIYNNLAFLYERKNKYKSSLFHLQIAEEIQNKYYANKYQDSKIPIEQLEKLSTTYSNLSAIQSKLGYNQEALLNIKFAIQLFSKNKENSQTKNLIFLYYNYSFLLQAGYKYSEAFNTATEGIKLSQKFNENEMKIKFEDLLNNLKAKLTKIQLRKQRQVNKYLKGQIGIVKNKQSLLKSKSQYHTMKQQQIIIQSIKDANQNDNKENKRKASSFYVKKYNIYHQKNSTVNNFTRYSFRSNQALNSKKIINYGASATQMKYTKKYNTKDITKIKQTLDQNKPKNATVNLQDNICFPVVNTDLNLIHNYGLDNRNRIRNRTYMKAKQEKPLIRRINATKKRLEEEIKELEKKNQVLEQLLEKVEPKIRKE